MPDPRAAAAIDVDAGIRLPSPSAHSETHPDHLAAIALLHGFAPTPITTSRILEIHSGRAVYLASLSALLPHAQLVGVSFSRSDQEAGRAYLAELQLQNVELALGVLDDLDSSLQGLEDFDFVVCHGLFSHLDEENQNRLLAQCGRLLSPRGIALISFNSEPGSSNLWILREVAGSASRHAPDRSRSPLEARRAIELFVRHLADCDADWARSLAEEGARVLQRDDQFLLLDILGPSSRPLFLREFLERVRRHGLRYLADARPGTWASAQRPPVRGQLEAHSSDPLEREQYLDLLRNRRQRRAILVRADAALVSDTPDPVALSFLRATPRLVPATRPVDLAPRFEVPFWPLEGGSPARIADPPIKAILAALVEKWPHSLPVAALPSLVAARLNQPGAPLYPADMPSWAPLILQAFTAGLISLHTSEPMLVSAPGERPTAIPPARLNALRQEPIENLWGRTVPIDPLDRLVLSLLDGTSDRAGLVDRLMRLDEARLQTPGRLQQSALDRRAWIENEILLPSLGRLAANALLIA
jgi:SAM-dependent methyltransferase